MSLTLLEIILIIILIITIIIIIIIGIILYLRKYKNNLDKNSKSIEKILENKYKESNSNLENKYKESNSNLEQKSKLIDNSLEKNTREINNNLNNINENLAKQFEKVKKHMDNLEKDRENKYSKLSEQLKQSTNETKELQKTTYKLKETLSNNQNRGQWGERMAEDILKIIGFREGIQYEKQKIINEEQEKNNKPDYIIKLPHNLKISMDVKFPINNYLKYLEQKDSTSKKNYKKNFLSDVTKCITDIKKRNYIDSSKTLDYVIIFIANEGIFSFINENNPKIIDESLEKKVIISSPSTLYAILSIIRVSIENFHFEKETKSMISLFKQFNDEWKKFTEQFNKIETKLNSAQEEFEKLKTTRKKKLEKPLSQIEEIRQKGETKNLV